MTSPLTGSARSQRLRAARNHGSRNGLAFVEVLDRALVDTAAVDYRQRVLLVHAVKPFDRGFRAEHVRIDGGVRITPVEVAWALPASFLSPPFPLSPSEEEAVAAVLPDPALRAVFEALAAEQDAPSVVLFVITSVAGDDSPYSLVLTPPHSNDFDPLLASLRVGFKVECPSPLDCAPAATVTDDGAAAPRIDYLAKDYASFRRLMLDRLALTMPDWTERSAADVGMALVEVMAYAADELSYYQDAVATEAYLGTARRRTSVRRHARLLGYRMHDGLNARTWICVRVSAELTLPGGTMLMTRVEGAPSILPPGSRALADALGQRPIVFETLHGATCTPAQNRLDFYTWGDTAAILPVGATEATLSDHVRSLQVGDVLVLAEVRSPVTGRAADADPTRRHAVRLTQVETDEDPLGGQFLEPPTDEAVSVTHIRWSSTDALPFSLCLTRLDVADPGDQLPCDDGEDALATAPASVVFGNVVLADHGQTVEVEALPPVPATGRFRPQLARGPLTFAVPYLHADARTRPAAEALDVLPGEGLPALRLDELPGDPRTCWTPRRDLLASDRFARDFVAETENDGTTMLRFGDGRHGREPQEGLVFQAVHRIGMGAEGNVGADAIGHIVTREPGVMGVSNPLPARGGVAPEPLERVRMRAPHALRTQRRAVTPADYAAVAQRYPEVQKAVASLRWTGAWSTVFITVDRTGGRPITPDFEAGLRSFLDPLRMAGQDLEIDGPRYVPLDIAMTVCMQGGYRPEDVLASLISLFSCRDLPDGRRGFFHPDAFTFGQSLYLSAIVSTALSVAGVRYVDLDPTPPKPNRFRRWHSADDGGYELGRLDVGRLEIIRLENDPNAPENGTLTFFMEGPA